MKLYDVMSDGEGSELKQRKLYFEGLGAHEGDDLPRLSRVGKVIYSGLEMALAWFVLRKEYPPHFTDNRPNRCRNVEKNVKDAYRWLAETYEKGDRVYLFGASRFAASSGRW